MVLESIERLRDGSPTECKINQNQQRNNWNRSQCGFPDDSRLLYGRCPPLSSRPHTACASKSLGSKVQQLKGGILFDGFLPNMFTSIWSFYSFTKGCMPVPHDFAMGFVLL